MTKIACYTSHPDLSRCNTLRQSLQDRRKANTGAAFGEVIAATDSLQPACSVERGNLPRFPSTQVRTNDGELSRWHVVCRLLASPTRESRRLAALLERMPTERRRHEIEDDCMRRPGAGRRGTGIPPGSILPGPERTPGALPTCATR